MRLPTFAEEQFWAAVDEGVVPERPQPVGAAVGPAIDAKLAHNLITKVRIAPADLVGLTQERAVEIWTAWLTAGAVTGGEQPDSRHS